MVRNGPGWPPSLASAAIPRSRGRDVRAGHHPRASRCVDKPAPHSGPAAGQPLDPTAGRPPPTAGPANSCPRAYAVSHHALRRVHRALGGCRADQGDVTACGIGFVRLAGSGIASARPHGPGPSGAVDPRPSGTGCDRGGQQRRRCASDEHRSRKTALSDRPPARAPPPLGDGTSKARRVGGRGDDGARP